MIQPNLRLPTATPRRLTSGSAGATGEWGDPKTLDVAKRADVPKPTFFEIHFNPDGKQVVVFVPIGNADKLYRECHRDMGHRVGTPG